MVSQTMSDETADDRTADEVRADVLRAARDALKNYSGDATTDARYDKRMAAERAFDAAMNTLRPVPVDERPDGLVGCVDDLTSLARKESRSKAEEALTDALETVLTRSIEDEDGEWVHVTDAEDLFEQGDEITVRYREHSGGADEEPGAWVKVTGTVGKVVPRGAGGIFVTIEEDTPRESTRKLHRVPGGTVTGTHPYGNRSVRKGLRAKVLLPEDASTDEESEDREAVTDGGVDTSEDVPDKVPSCVVCRQQPTGLTDGMSAVPEGDVDPANRRVNDHVPAVNAAGDGHVWVCNECRTVLHAEGETVRVCHHKLRVTEEHPDAYTLHGEVAGVHQDLTATKQHVHEQLTDAEVDR